MKKQTFILAFICSTLFFNCTKDDELLIIQDSITATSETKLETIVVEESNSKINDVPTINKNVLGGPSIEDTPTPTGPDCSSYIPRRVPFGASLSLDVFNVYYQPSLSLSEIECFRKEYFSRYPNLYMVLQGNGHHDVWGEPDIGPTNGSTPSAKAKKEVGDDSRTCSRRRCE